MNSERKKPGVAFWATVVGVLLGSIGYTGYSTITAALDAEYELHALICTLELVEEFVKQNDRWPKSWDELERLPVARPRSMYKWPKDRARIEERVTVDFEHRLEELARLQESALLPIRVRSTYYDFSDRYKPLFDTIKERVRTMNTESESP